VDKYLCIYEYYETTELAIIEAKDKAHAKAKMYKARTMRENYHDLENGYTETRSELLKEHADDLDCIEVFNFDSIPPDFIFTSWSLGRDVSRVVCPKCNHIIYYSDDDFDFVCHGCLHAGSTRMLKEEASSLSTIKVKRVLKYECPVCKKDVVEFASSPTECPYCQCDLIWYRCEYIEEATT